MPESPDAIARSLTRLFETLERRDPHTSLESGVPELDARMIGQTLGREEEPDLAQVEVMRGMLTPEVATEIARELGTSTPDDEHRTRLVRAIRRLGPQMAEPLGTAITEDPERSHRRAYIEGLVALGPAALPVATRMMEDSRWYVVRNAIDILRDAAGQAGMEHFTTGLAHDHPKVRRQAIHALGHLGGEAAGLLVPSKISDVDPEVRKAAAMATGQLRVVRAVKTLLERLEEEPAVDVQVEILLALGRIGDPGAVPAIEKRAEPGLFQRIPTEVRVAAYRALWWIGTPRARKMVRDAEKDKNADVREAVDRITSTPLRA